MATDLETLLLQNVRATLRDTANHTALTNRVKQRSRIAPVLMRLFTSAPYCVVTPGDLQGNSVGMLEDVGIGINVWVVGAIVNDALSEKSLIRATGALGSLCRLVRDALVRPEPWRAAPYDGAPYTAIPGIDNCLHVNTGAPVALPDEETGGAPFHIARPVRLSYTGLED